MFHQYKSIESFKNIPARAVDDNFNWVATEKIHGSNFSFITDGVTVATAKRTTLLVNEKFFGLADSVFEPYHDDVRQIFALCLLFEPNLVSLQIFGELFGGKYANLPSRMKNPIQPEILYNNEPSFLVFDIKIVAQQEESEILFLSHTEVCNLLASEHIVLLKHAPVLAYGTLAEVRAVNKVFITTVPNLFGLDTIEDNYAEGFVIKVDRRDNYADKRTIYKIKNKKFGEIYKNNKKAGVGVSKKRPNIIAYITSSRFDNTVSKFGLNNKSEIKERYIEDILTNYANDNAGNAGDLGVLKNTIERYIESKGIIENFMKKWLQ